MVVCHAAQENGACENGVSILVGKGVPTSPEKICFFKIYFPGLDGQPFQPPPAQMACAGQLNKGPLKRTKAPAIKRDWTPLSQDPLAVESY